jgi:hypothetical protein
MEYLPVVREDGLCFQHQAQARPEGRTPGADRLALLRKEVGCRDLRSGFRPGVVDRIALVARLDILDVGVPSQHMSHIHFVYRELVRLRTGWYLKMRRRITKSRSCLSLPYV